MLRNPTKKTNIRNSRRVSPSLTRGLNPLRQCLTDMVKQYEKLKEMLGSVGEKVRIAKTFNCDNVMRISGI